MDALERDFRDRWAAYCNARARKSQENARRLPHVADHWNDVAAGEQACALMLRGSESLDDLFAALEEPPPQCRYCRGTAEGNAQLFAAAPELLDALYTIRQAFTDGHLRFTKKRQTDSDPFHPANVKMCAAIAKAEGRA
jgi:hypothetical protein